MNKRLLQIDVSNSKTKEEDLLTIRFQNNDVLQFNFSKLVSQSKYILDKYKYSEALELIQPEIEEIETKYNISEESIKLFIRLIQDEKINIPIENYKDIYTLSEYFCIPKFINALTNIGRDEIYQDLDFTIQILLDSESSNDSLETKIMCNIEKFLIERINECIKNAKFRELSVSTICRIVELSKEKVDHNLLVDFIFESANIHFILFKFVEFGKLADDKVAKVIKIIEEKEETTKMCLECIPFNFSFIKNIKYKYDQLFNELNFTKQELNQTKREFDQTKQQLNQTKQELNQTKQEFDQTKQELNQTKQEFDQTKQELNQTKQELNQTKQEFDQTKQELNQTKQELNQTKQEFDQIKQELNQTKQELNQTKQEFDQIKQELNQTKQELNQTKQEFDQTKQELNQTKQELNQTKQEFDQIKQELNQTKQELNQTKQQFEKTKQELNQINQNESNRQKSEKNQIAQFIIVGGNDGYHQLGEEPNKKSKDGNSIISPPVKLSFDPSSLLSYSIYCDHSVLVMRDGSLKGIGNNRDGSISGTLQKTVINNFTDICIKDDSGRQLAAISAVCCFKSTLYMLSKSSGSGRQLVLCDNSINKGKPVFLDIGNHHPVSLFGGRSYSAVIGSEGEVIFINRNSIKKFPNSQIAAVSLPDGEKASSVACCDDSVVVLSSNGRVFSSPIEEENSILKFSAAQELSGHEIVCVSGIFKHFLAVSKEGRVFGCGSNKCGKLGFEKEIKSVSSFTEILSLGRYKIRAAYAGWCHSLFETQEGKILSCGFNSYGQLLLSSGPSGKVYLPTETTITSGAAFCIAACSISIIFIGDPPPNAPNMRIQYH